MIIVRYRINHHSKEQLENKSLVMEAKNIVLFERYDGVRFVLERSLSKLKDEITIFSSHGMDEIKHQIKNKKIDLLITELNHLDAKGLEISHYAREHFPKMAIIWITVMGCNEFREQQKIYNILQCIEKPLEICEFRKDVLEALYIRP